MKVKTNLQRIVRIINHLHRRGNNSERVNEIYRKIIKCKC
jgi:hypothetical protein